MMFAQVAVQLDAMEAEEDGMISVVDNNTSDKKVVNTLPSCEEIHQQLETPVTADDASSSTDRNDYMDIKSNNDCEEEYWIDGLENDDSRPPLSDELQQGYRILQDLMSDSNKAHNFLFMDLVDASDSEMSDYYERIQDPICLKTMLEKFESREYTSITEFYDDFKRMIKNCWRYWGTDHKMGKKAERFDTMFQQKIALLSSRVKEKVMNHSTGLDDGFSSAGLRRRGRASMSQDSCRMFLQVRQELAQEEKEMRIRQQAERKAERKAQQQEILDWDKVVLFDNRPEEMKAMWEIPQIQAFLWAAKMSLNLEEINIFETERAFYMPKQSSALQKIMTSLLSTPAQRARLDRRSAKPMPYRVWNEKLKKRMDAWYKALKDCNGNHVQAAYKVGIEKNFFSILGVKRNPLEKRDFHDLTPFQRVWIVKSLCENILETQVEIRDAMEREDVEELRGLELGQDVKGFTYIHFPQFCGPAVRFYRQAPWADPNLDSDESEEDEEKEEVEQSSKASSSSSRNRSSRSRTSTPQPVPQRENKKRISSSTPNTLNTPRLNGQSAKEDSVPEPKNPSECEQGDIQESTSNGRSRRRRGGGSIRGQRTRNGICNDFGGRLGDCAENSIAGVDAALPTDSRTCNGVKEDRGSALCEDDLLNQRLDLSDTAVGSSPRKSRSERISKARADKAEMDSTDSPIPLTVSGSMGKKPLCNGDSQEQEEEDMDWESSSQDSKPSFGDRPDASVRAKSSPQTEEESSSIKREAQVDQDVTVKSEPDGKPGVGEEQNCAPDKGGSLGTGDVSGCEKTSESAVPKTLKVKQESDRSSLKREAEQLEESDTEEVDIKGPTIGEFELIIDSVEGLRQFVEELEQPEIVVSKKGKKGKQVTRQVPRKKCEQELAQRLRESVKELTRWEGKLNMATWRARNRVRREFEEYKPEEPAQPEANVWETESDSSENVEEEEKPQDSNQPALSGETNNRVEARAEVKREESENPTVMEYEIEYSSRGRMRKRKTTPEDRAAKRSRTGEGGEDSQIMTRLPNILQRQSKAPNSGITILSAPGKSGTPGATVQLVSGKPDANSALISASQLLRWSVSNAKPKVPLAVVSDGTQLRPSPPKASAASGKTVSHPVIQQLLARQPQILARSQPANSLAARPPGAKPLLVVSAATAAGTLGSSSSSSSTGTVQYIITNSTPATSATSGTARSQQAVSLTSELIQQLIRSGQFRLQAGASASGTTTLVLASPQQSATRPEKVPQPAVLVSQSVLSPTLGQPRAAASTISSVDIKQGQLTAVVPGIAGQKAGQGTRYASNVTVKALLENRAAQKAGVPSQGGVASLVLGANSAGIPTLVSSIQPQASSQATGPSAVIPTTITKTFTGDLDSAVRLVVTSVNTSLPTANIHVPSPALSPNLARGNPAQTIMTSVMEQPIVTSKVQSITSPTMLSSTPTLTTSSAAQVSLALSASTLTSTAAPGSSTSPKAVVCKVVQPDGQPVYQILLSQDQPATAFSTGQPVLTSAPAATSLVKLGQSAAPGAISPAMLQAAALKAQLAGSLKPTMSTTIQSQHPVATPVSLSPTGAKMLGMSPQTQLLQAPAAALVKQIATGQLAQPGSLTAVRVQGSVGSLLGGQVTSTLPASSLMAPLASGISQTLVGQSAAASPQSSQLLKVAGLGKTAVVLNVSQSPGTQRLQTFTVQNANNNAGARSAGSIQVPGLVVPQQGSSVLNLQLLQNKLSGLTQGQVASSVGVQPTRMVLVAQPAASQTGGATQGVLQQATPHLLRQIIAGGVKSPTAGQPQIILTPSVGGATVAKAQVVGQGLPGVGGRTVSVISPSPAATAGLTGQLQGSVPGTGVTGLGALNSIQLAPAASAPVISRPGAPLALQVGGLKVAGLGTNTTGRTIGEGLKLSSAGSGELSSSNAGQVASSALQAQRVTSMPGKQAASNSAGSTVTRTAEAPRKIKLLNVNSQLYTPEGVPVTLGSDGQLKVLPLPRLLLPPQLRAAVQQSSQRGSVQPASAMSVAPSQPAASSTSVGASAVASSLVHSQTFCNSSASDAGLRLTLSVPCETTSEAASGSRVPSGQQQQPQDEEDATMLLMNFANGIQKP